MDQKAQANNETVSGAIVFREHYFILNAIGWVLVKSCHIPFKPFIALFRKTLFALL